MNKVNMLIAKKSAKNLATKLGNLKYNVVDIVSFGKAVVEKVGVRNLDLILMDIVIEAYIDEVQTANIIKENHNVAAVF